MDEQAREVELELEQIKSKAEMDKRRSERTKEKGNWTSND